MCYLLHVAIHIMYELQFVAFMFAVLLADLSMFSLHCSRKSRRGEILVTWQHH